MQPAVLSRQFLIGTSTWVTFRTHKIGEFGTHTCLVISQAEAALEHAWIVRKAEKTSGCWSGIITAKCGEVMKNQQFHV
jgi:hypothetical protein